MTSERKVEANRRNARKSTGPRSNSGKKRAARNAFRHGLTKHISSAEFDRKVEKLARQIGGDNGNKITGELARGAADAMLELARVRRVKVALIERVVALGRFDVAPRFASDKDELAWVMQRYCGVTLWEGRPKFAVDPVSSMPTQEPQRTAEAVRRILKELSRLARYENRAIGRRDRAIRAIMLANNPEEQ
jgi:hypothetical protein